MDATQPAGELIGLTGRQKGKRYPLDKPLWKIGSDEACDLRLLVDSVQPVHALLVVAGGMAVLTSWDRGEVFVDGNPIEQEYLRDKSILRFGPFQFQLRLRAPESATLRIRTDEPEEEAPPALPVGSSADTVEDRRQQIEALQRQLRDSRARFRDEQRRKEAEIEQQFRDLAEAFDEADRREDRAEKERERLLSLRSRMIKRWKRHWAAERKSVERQTEVIQADLARLVAKTAAFESERDETLARIDSEKNTLRERENQIEVEHAAWEVTRDEERRRIDLDRLELDEGRQALDKKDRQLRGEHKKLDRQVRNLQREADGLESRVRNLRKQLAELEKKKDSFTLKVTEEPEILKLSEELPPGAIYIKSPLRPEEALQERRREKLESLARSIADQQAVLVEQLDRMSIAKEFWRAEEKRVVEELERLSHEMQAQDDGLTQRDEELTRREQQLLQEQQAIREQRLQIEAAQSRLALQESQFKGERDRKRAEINQSQRHADRVQQTYEKLCHRWLTTRAEEEDQRQTAHQKLQELRERWLAAVASEQAERRRLEDRERQLAQREMVLELTRQSLAEKSDNKPLFEKRLERHRRHVMSAFRRAEEKLVLHREALDSEAESMKELFAVATDRLRVAHIREDAVRKEAIEFQNARTEFQMKLEAETDREERWKLQNEAYEREIGELRAELLRLLPSEGLEMSKAA